MTEELELRVGKIPKAYCYETDSIDDPHLAHRKVGWDPDLHYFCPENECGWPLSGGVKSRASDTYRIAWFVGQAIPDGVLHSHAEGCKHAEKRRTSTGNGESHPPNEPAKLAEPFIPRELIDPSAMRRKAWRGAGPSKEELQRLIRAAHERPIFGTIEDVMDADLLVRKQWDHFMRHKDDAALERPILNRKSLGLSISGEGATYHSSVVEWSDAMSHLGDADNSFWEQHIIRFTGIARRDSERSGAYLLTPYGEELSFRVDLNASRWMKSKDYLPALLEAHADGGQQVRCYWWNLRPVIQPNGFQLLIDNPRAFGLAAFREMKRL